MKVSQIRVAAKVLSVRGLSDFTLGIPDNEGFFNIIATGGIEYSPGRLAIWDRGNDQKEGAKVNIYNQKGGEKQKFKLEAINAPSM